MEQQALFSHLQIVKTSHCCWEITSASITQEKVASLNQKCFSLKLPFGVFHRNRDICLSISCIKKPEGGGGGLMSAVISSCAMFLFSNLHLVEERRWQGPETCGQKLAGWEQMLSISDQTKFKLLFV